MAKIDLPSGDFLSTWLSLPGIQKMAGEWSRTPDNGHGQDMSDTKTCRKKGKPGCIIGQGEHQQGGKKTQCAATGQYPIGKAKSECAGMPAYAKTTAQNIPYM